VKFHPSFFDRLREKLVGESGRSIYLHALPGRTGSRLELHDLYYVLKGAENRFLQLLLSEEAFSLELPFPTTEIPSDSPLKTIFRKLQNAAFEHDNLLKETGVASFSFGYPLLVHQNQDRIWASPLFIWQLDIHMDPLSNAFVISRNRTKCNGRWTVASLHEFSINETLGQHFKRMGRPAMPELEGFLNEDDVLSVDEMHRFLVQFAQEQGYGSEAFDPQLLKSYLGASVLPLPNRDRLALEFQEKKEYLLFSGVFGIFKQRKSAIIKELNGLESVELFPPLPPKKRIPFSPIPTDPSQQSVLMNLGEAEVTVIQGPPGTGKSQTLTAIITQALLNKEKILVVCEKKTAMEVLAQNLLKVDPRLGQHLALIEDPFADRDEVVTKAREKIERKETEEGNAFSKTVLTQMEQLENDVHHYEERLSKLQSPLFDQKNWMEWVEYFDEIGGPIELNEDLPHLPFSFEENEYQWVIQTSKSIQQWQEEIPQFFQHPFFEFSSEQLSPTSFPKHFSDLFQSVYRWKQLEDELQRGNDSGNWKQYLQTWEKWKADDKTLQNEFAQWPCIRWKGFSLTLRKWLSAISTSLKADLDKRDVWLKKWAEWKQMALTLGETTAAQLEWPTDEISFSTEPNGWQRSNLLSPSVLQLLQDRANIQTNLQRNPILPAQLPFSQVDLMDWLTTNEKSVARSGLMHDIKKAWDGFSPEQKTWAMEIARRKTSTQAVLRWYLHWFFQFKKDLSLPSDVNEPLQLAHRLRHLAPAMLDFIHSQELERTRLALQKFKEKGISPIGLYNKRGAKGQKRNPLRQIIATDTELFTDLFPVVMMNPVTACQILPSNAALFDWILLDESSQLRVEDTFCCLRRANRAIVSGDEQQMPPSDYFSSDFSLTPDEEESGEWTEKEAQKSLTEAESLLDFALQLPQSNRLPLSIHYRSEHPLLIQFSNAAFYQNQLIPIAADRMDSPIHFHSVNGNYEDATNQKEAEALVEAIKKIQPLPNGNWPSFGIGTLNLYQRNLILASIAQKQLEDADFRAVWQHLEGSAFVKNLEHIQGDERDVLFISTTFGPDRNGKFRRNFGPISQKNGYRLLNVLITRAKKRMEIFCSFPKEVFQETSTILQEQGKTGGYYFLSFLKYAQACSQLQWDTANSVLQEVSQNGVSANPSPQLFAHWSAERKKALIKDGGVQLKKGTRFLWNDWGKTFAERKNFWVHQTFSLRWLTHYEEEKNKMEDYRHR